MRTPRKGGVGRAGGERNVGARQSASLFVRGVSQAGPGAVLQPERGCAGSLRRSSRPRARAPAGRQSLPHAQTSPYLCRGGSRRRPPPRPGPPCSAGPAPAPSGDGRARAAGAPLRGRAPGGARRAPPPGPPPCRARTRSRRRRSSRPRTAAPRRGPSTTVTRAAARAARRRARSRMEASGSSAVTWAPGAYQRSCAPVPVPISSTRPRALRGEAPAPATDGGALERPHDRVVHGGVAAGRG